MVLSQAMDANEQALRDHIAFQLGRFATTILRAENFEIEDYIDPIVEAAKRLARAPAGLKHSQGSSPLPL